MKMYAIADQLRRQKVCLGRLSENKNAADDRHLDPCAILQCGERHRQGKASRRARDGNDCQNPDQQTECKSRFEAGDG